MKKDEALPEGTYAIRILVNTKAENMRIPAAIKVDIDSELNLHMTQDSDLVNHLSNVFQQLSVSARKQSHPFYPVEPMVDKMNDRYYLGTCEEVQTLDPKVVTPKMGNGVTPDMFSITSPIRQMFNDLEEKYRRNRITLRFFVDITDSNKDYEHAPTDEQFFVGVGNSVVRAAIYHSDYVEQAIMTVPLNVLTMYTLYVSTQEVNGKHIVEDLIETVFVQSTRVGQKKQAEQALPVFDRSK